MPLRLGINPFTAIFFAFVGLYLVIIGHRRARSLAPWFVGLATAYLAWSLALIIIRGEANMSNRQVTYSLLIFVSAFIANGLVLVRDPIRFFVIGSRLGVIAAALSAVAFSLMGELRVGLGGNPAPFAMVAAICMIAAIIRVRNAPRWLPNSIVFAVVGSIPILLSETRALLAIIPIVLVVECAIWTTSKPRKVQMAAALGALAFGAAILSTGPVHNLIDRLITPAVLYYSGYQDEWSGSASGDIRLSLWQGAMTAISERPLSGYGEDRMDMVVSHAPAMHEYLGEFRHVHNLFLDEALIHGLPGLVILISLMTAGLVHVCRFAGDKAIVRSAVYFTAAVLFYGFLHNPFQHETTICAIFFYLGVLIAGTARDRQHKIDDGRSMPARASVRVFEDR